LSQKDLYSQFDSKGIPTHYVDGLVLSKSLQKRLVKQWEKQNEKHKEYLTQNNSAVKNN